MNHKALLIRSFVGGLALLVATACSPDASKVRSQQFKINRPCSSVVLSGYNAPGQYPPHPDVIQDLNDDGIADAETNMPGFASHISQAYANGELDGSIAATAERNWEWYRDHSGGHVGHQTYFKVWTDAQHIAATEVLQAYCNGGDVELAKANYHKLLDIPGS
jgi:ABC-type transport system substrate-binding protein